MTVEILFANHLCVLVVILQIYITNAYLVDLELGKNFVYVRTVFIKDLINEK